MMSRPPGRPKDAEKHRAIITAAEEVFFDRGFAATTVAAVAERAGVSKVTIYARFQDKAGLFEAMVKQVSDRMVAKCDVLPNTSAFLEERLVAFGMGLLSELLSPRLIAFERNLAGELSQHPALAKRFFEAGPLNDQRRLSIMIAEAAAKGDLDVTDPMHAAADLYGLWQGVHMIEVRFGIANPPSQAKLGRIVKSGVARFLKAYRISN